MALDHQHDYVLHLYRMQDLIYLLAFNLGVELGQLLVLLLLIPALSLLFRFMVAERMGTIILSALVAHTGWHWMTERGETLRKFHFALPEWNAAFAAGLLRGLMWLVILTGLLRGFLQLRKRRRSE